MDSFQVFWNKTLERSHRIIRPLDFWFLAMCNQLWSSLVRMDTNSYCGVFQGLKVSCFCCYFYLVLEKCRKNTILNLLFYFLLIEHSFSAQYSWWYKRKINKKELFLFKKKMGKYWNNLLTIGKSAFPQRNLKVISMIVEKFLENLT